MMKQRDIVFLKFPYSDFSDFKARPALIISNDRYNKESQDILVCAITSNLEKTPYSIFISGIDVEDGQLPVKSKIRADKIIQASKTIIFGKLATLGKKKFSETTSRISELSKS